MYWIGDKFIIRVAYTNVSQLMLLTLRDNIILFAYRTLHEEQIHFIESKIELLESNGNSVAKMVSARALHFVLKIGNRGANLDFFRKILGMKVIRNNPYCLHFFLDFQYILNTL